ncbi:heterokaryon incompatibility protein-domain-containing protein [Thelonectria olida]|uniref:Heterokaryon incompatibility protein-domain-containing protein n=1 Tax=Thelonectria olida TaxID=1576542 RepID=A0A9P9AJZ8_9HYPO|nr:heterokaryon incompatibility protein-domain-containing protein [Thelonectria olida]
MGDLWETITVYDDGIVSILGKNRNGTVIRVNHEVKAIGVSHFSLKVAAVVSVDINFVRCSYWDRGGRNVSDIVSYGRFESINKQQVLTKTYITNENVTRAENCGNYCLLKKYTYWDLQKGTTCSCGWELAMNSKKVDYSKCSTDCVGGGDLPCGGEKAINVYGFSENLRRAYTKIGCYVDRYRPSRQQLSSFLVENPPRAGVHRLFLLMQSNAIHTQALESSSPISTISPMDFKYPPLSKGQIRLLRLLPWESRDGPLRGTIDHFFLSQAQGYDALSYTWGPNDQKGSIQICHPDDGSESNFPLTSNLSAALKRIRQPKTFYTIWIDQICINQADVDEKSVQVPLMSRIYEAADRVVLWLGEEDVDTSLAFQDLAYTPKEMKEIRAELSSPTSAALTENEEIRLVAANWPIGKVQSGAWKAATLLFQREVFERVWVVQEVVLGRQVVVRCGSFATEWNDLADVSALHRHTSSGVEKAPDIIAIVDSIRQNFQVRGCRMKHADVMFNSHFFKTSNPRDKVYGTLGLLETGTVPALPVRYTASVEDVYLDCAIHCIETTSSLDILSSIVGPGCPSLPSWVPDCRIESRIRSRIAPSKASPTFHSSLIGPFAFSISPNRRMFSTTGLILSEIHSLGDVYAEQWQSVELAWMKMAQEAASENSAVSFPLNYHRALCASDDVAVPGSANYEQDIEGFDAWSFWITYWGGEQGGYPGKHGNSQKAQSFSTRMLMCCTGRRMALTCERTLVLGPHASQIGDKVKARGSNCMD